MERRRVVLLVAILALLLVALAWRLFAPPEDEAARILQMLEDVRQEVEAKSASGVVGYLAEDFQDAHGNDRKALKPWIAGWFFRTRIIGLRFGGQRVDLAPSKTEATVRLAAWVSEGARPISGEMGQLYRVDLAVVKRDGDWIIRRLDYRALQSLADFGE